MEALLQMKPGQWEWLKAAAITVALRIVAVILVLVIGFRLVKFIERRMLKNRSWLKMDPTLQSFLRSFLRMGLKFLVVVVAIYAAGVEMSSFVAIIGAAGLAVGLALQGSLSNLAGGVLIIALRPFKVGDYIDVASQSGTVSEIGLFYTWLTTLDNRAVILPNAAVSGSTLVNYGIYPTRRADFKFSAAYGADSAEVRRVLMETVKADSRILSTPEPFVKMSGHGASSVEYTVRVWANVSEYWDVYFDMFEAVKTAFDAHGIEIPYPQMVVHSEKGCVHGDGPTA